MMTGLERALADAVRHAGPDTVALMRVLMEAPTEAEARAGMVRAQSEAAIAGDVAAEVRLRRLAALWAAHPQAWRAVRGTADGIAHTRPGGTPDEVLAYWAHAFDRLVARAPEASVALYSLGSPGLLAEATEEIVERMAAWGLLTPHAHILDLGCGIGRFLVALAPRVARVRGLDLSAGMVAEARRRCATFGNVTVDQSSGRDLAGVTNASLDLVLASDMFPYLVEAGGGLVDQHVGEAARVLRPGGALLALNWSYRGDLAADRCDARGFANAYGFELERDGTRDFALWDGAAFLLRRPAT